MMAAVTPTTAGWYPDPNSPGLERYWYGSEWSPNQVRMAGARGAALPGYQGTAPAATRGATDRPAWLWPAAVAVVGAALMLGSLLTWATVDAGIISVSEVGTYHGGDGWITLVAGALVVVAAAGLLRAWWRPSAWLILGALAVLASLATAIYEVIHLETLPAGFTTGGFKVNVDVSLGGGLILVLVAALVGVVAVVQTWRNR
jgi:hypothetical protein